MSYDVLKIKQEYEASRLETAEGDRDARHAQGRARPPGQAARGAQAVVVPARDRRPRAGRVRAVRQPRQGRRRATALYGCQLGMVFCHKVGTVLEVLPGEVQFKHPHSDKMLRGQMVELKLDDDAARDRRRAVRRRTAAALLMRALLVAASLVLASRTRVRRARRRRLLRLRRGRRRRDERDPDVAPQLFGMFGYVEQPPCAVNPRRPATLRADRRRALQPHRHLRGHRDARSRATPTAGATGARAGPRRDQRARARREGQGARRRARARPSRSSRTRTPTSRRAARPRRKRPRRGCASRSCASSRPTRTAQLSALPPPTDQRSAGARRYQHADADMETDEAQAPRARRRSTSACASASTSSSTRRREPDAVLRGASRSASTSARCGRAAPTRAPPPAASGSSRPATIRSASTRRSSALRSARSRSRPSAPSRHAALVAELERQLDALAQDRRRRQQALPPDRVVRLRQGQGRARVPRRAPRQRCARCSAAGARMKWRMLVLAMIGRLRHARASKPRPPSAPPSIDVHAGRARPAVRDARARSPSGAIAEPTVRAFARGSRGDAAQLAFTYRGRFRARRARSRRASCAASSASSCAPQDSCNVVYVMWRLDPKPELEVSVKRNPGKRTHEECGADGYTKVQAGTRACRPRARGRRDRTRCAPRFVGDELVAWIDGAARLARRRCPPRRARSVGPGRAAHRQRAARPRSSCRAPARRRPTGVQADASASDLRTHSCV